VAAAPVYRQLAVSSEPSSTTVPPQDSPDIATVLSFLVGARTRVALRSTWVREVLAPHALTPMPGAPSHVCGIAQIGGRPVPVVDLGPFFSLATPTSADDNDMPRLLLVHGGTMEVALVGRSVLVEDLPIERDDEERSMFGARLRPHVRGRVQTRRGVAVMLDLPGVLEAARVQA
jgi:purine-binding chemotaxis protein CheW